MQLLTSKAPKMDHRSGVSLKTTTCQRKARAMSVVARTTETGPACSSWSDRVRRSWPQKLKTPRMTMRYQSKGVAGREKPSRRVVMTVVSMTATQPKLNMITAWWAPEVVMKRMKKKVRNHRSKTSKKNSTYPSPFE